MKTIVILFAGLVSILVFLAALKITPLIDYSYQVENSYRIYQGQMPYRDFFLVLPPGTYVLLALGMKLAGGYSHLQQVGIAMIVGFLTVMVTARILRYLEPQPLTNVLFLLPLLFTGQVIYPYPLYDFFAIAFLLIALLFLLWLYHTPHPHLSWYLTAGILVSLATYFKQNIGLAFSLGVIGVVWGVCMLKRNQKAFSHAYVFTLGVIISYGLFVLFLLFTHTLPAFLYQTFTFPQNAKYLSNSIAMILKQYRQYGELSLQNLPLLIGLILGSFAVSHFVRNRWVIRVWEGIVALGMVIFLYQYVVGRSWFATYTETFLTAWLTLYLLSFLGIIVKLFHAKNEQQILISLVPLSLVASAHATYLSHQIVGSSYGLWPVFVILLPYAMSALRWMFPRLEVRIPIGILLLYITSVSYFYVQKATFLSYVSLEGNPKVATYPKISGMSTPGPWIPAMEEMFTFVEKNIPKTSRVAFVPGEDPFFAVTGRKNPMPYSQLHPETYPLREKDLAAELVTYDVEWVIVKTRLQLLPLFPVADLSHPSYALERFFTPVVHLSGYTIYKKK